MQTLSTLKGLNNTKKKYRNLINEKTKNSTPIKFSKIGDDKQRVTVGSKTGAYSELIFAITENELHVHYVINTGTVYSKSQSSYLQYTLGYLIEVARDFDLDKIIVPIQNIDYIGDSEHVFNDMRFENSEECYLLHLGDGRYFEFDSVINETIRIFEGLKATIPTTTFKVSKINMMFTASFHYRGYNGLLSLIPEDNFILINEKYSKKQFYLEYKEASQIQTSLLNLLEELYEENKISQIIKPSTPHFDSFCKSKGLLKSTTEIMKNFLLEHDTSESIELLSVVKKRRTELSQDTAVMINFGSFHFVFENKKRENETVFCYTQAQKEEAYEKFKTLATANFLKALDDDIEYYDGQTS